MRITNNMLINNMTYNLNSSLKRMELLQYQSAKGKRFRVPSDDPIGASKSLKFSTDISKVEQYQRNAKDAESWMKETEGALMEINKVLKRSYELTNQAANGTNSPDDLEKIKAEITELKGHLIQISNTTYAGRSIFTGYKTDKPLLDEDGNYIVGKTKEDDGTYTGDADLKNNEVFVYNVGVAETVSVNVLGNKVFGSVKGDGTPDYDSEIGAGSEPYLIHMFKQLEEALGNIPTDGTDSTAPDQELLQSSITNLQAAMDNIMSVTAEVGAKSNRLEMTTDKLKSQSVNLEELLSFNEDIGLPEAYMKLMMEENVYRASLSVGAKVIQPSLVDFLR